MLVQQQNHDGTWSQAQPMARMCEHEDCLKPAVAECKRQQPGLLTRVLCKIAGIKPDEWADEPICLCQDHLGKCEVIYHLGMNHEVS